MAAKKKMKTGIKLLLGVLGVFALLFAVLIASLLTAGKKMDAVNTVDINTVKDGSYYGAADAVLVKAEVKVDVKDHRIVNIELLKHQNGKGTPAEAIIGTIINKNSSNVDAVSGATLSSKTIRAAVNRALASGAAQ